MLDEVFLENKLLLNAQHRSHARLPILNNQGSRIHCLFLSRVGSHLRHRTGIRLRVWMDQWAHKELPTIPPTWRKELGGCLLRYVDYIHKTQRSEKMYSHSRPFEQKTQMRHVHATY